MLIPENWANLEEQLNSRETERGAPKFTNENPGG